jgi:polyisoprenoid-binding protein YceI
MKRKLYLLFFLASLTTLASAQKYATRTGFVRFFSKTPMENIEATTHQASCIADIATGEVVAKILISSFQFEKALMQEHFNENYMESTKFPKSTFKGKITNLDKIDFKKDGTYSAEVTGDLTMHGVTKNISTSGTIEVAKGVITAKAKFKVVPKDYGIQIPQLVENKIAKEMEITVEIPYATN